MAISGLLLATTGAAGAQVSPHAPVTTSSNGGRSASDGVRSVSVSQAVGLDPAGQSIRVTGAGFAPERGIYLAFCLVPPTDQPPTPCGGGWGDQTASTGSSRWIRSDAYGADNGADPFGPGGTFDVTLSVSPALADGIDCRQARCAIITRADHKATSDRSLDLFVPVSFAAESPGATTASTAPAPPPAVVTTIPLLAPSQIAPTATVAADGRSVSDGSRTLSASAVRALDAAAAEVHVEGTGFDPAKGIYVALCALPLPDPALPTGAAPAPGPCAGGSAAASAWVSSNPPDYGKGIAAAYGAGGSFATDLILAAVIDADHDCREVACAVVTRHDDTAVADRTQDLYLPVEFATAREPADSDDVNAVPAPVVAGVTGALVLAGAGTTILIRRRRVTA